MRAQFALARQAVPGAQAPWAICPSTARMIWNQIGAVDVRSSCGRVSVDIPASSVSGCEDIGVLEPDVACPDMYRSWTSTCIP